MRLLHFADLHLGIENYGTIDPSTGLSTRVADFLAAFDAIVDRAIADPVDAVLFAGDAFKNRDPNPTIQREFARRIRRLSEARIPIVLLVGNHDLPNAATRATANEIYRVLEVPGVHVCREVELLRIETVAGPLQIVALPWITRSRFLANEEFRLLADLDLDRAMGHAISGALRELISQLNSHEPSVLLAHVSMQGASLGYEQSIMLGQDVTVGLDELQASSFDYIALGHIHKHQFVGTNPPAVYPGSPERIDFGEETETKGFVLVDICRDSSRFQATATFVPLETRRFFTLRIEASGDAPMVAVERAIQREAQRVAGAIVRCFVEVDPGRERAVLVGDVRKRLVALGAQYVAQVVVESETVSRARWELTEQSERDSMSMLQRWVAMKDYDQALRDRILARGQELIERRRHRQEGEPNLDG